MRYDGITADQLRRGLARLGPTFTARICGVCEGEGSYSQTYNAGCGMGYYSTKGPCDWCKETGLMQGDRPAPRSVLNQVATAGRRDDAEPAKAA